MMEAGGGGAGRMRSLDSWAPHGDKDVGERITRGTCTGI